MVSGVEVRHCVMVSPTNHDTYGYTPCVSNVFIFHGIYGHPKENWFPWLKENLERKGTEVYTPYLPTKDKLSLEDWLNAFEPYKNKITKDSIFIGHSLGAALVLHLLETFTVQATIFVAPAWGKTNNQFTKLMAPIAEQDFDWIKIKSHCSNFIIFHSDNDPYLPLERAETLAKYLEIKITIIPNAGHFNENTGYTSFEDLLKKISPLL